MQRCECKLVMDRLGPLSVNVIVSAVLSSLFSADQNIVAAAFVLLSPREGVEGQPLLFLTRVSLTKDKHPLVWNAVSSMEEED